VNLFLNIPCSAISLVTPFGEILILDLTDHTADPVKKLAIVWTELPGRLLGTTVSV